MYSLYYNICYRLGWGGLFSYHDMVGVMRRYKPNDYGREPLWFNPNT